MSSPFDGSVVIMADNSIIFWLNHLYTNETYWLSIASSVRDVFNESIGDSLKHHGAHSAKTGLTLPRQGSLCQDRAHSGGLFRGQLPGAFKPWKRSPKFWIRSHNKIFLISSFNMIWVVDRNSKHSGQHSPDRQESSTEQQLRCEFLRLSSKSQKIVLVPRSSRKVWWSWSEQLLQYQEKMDI